jgi:methylenetetrahydrofolate dehydrogenase (NADP+)/methenyltetrahydrofolate cyclohydrolase
MNGNKMAPKLLVGKEIGERIRAELKKEIEGLRKKGIVPGLAVILVGEDPGSVSYVTNKAKACSELGIHEETIRLPAGTSEKELLELVERLNMDTKFHGILVQLPLPEQMDPRRVLLKLSPEKDVDGFHPENVGRMMLGEPRFAPCTPAGIQEMLIRSGIDPSGKHVVICGRSNIVGKPLANLLFQKAKGANATVTLCHTGTKDIANFTRQADILVAAMGKPKLITADMVKDGAVVIDVGSNLVKDPSTPKGTRFVGDVDFEAVKDKASAITPVPGGVGPMTITMLMVNTVKAAKLAGGIK